jgi:hypothetical protein
MTKALHESHGYSRKNIVGVIYEFWKLCAAARNLVSERDPPRAAWAEQKVAHYQRA